jgi:hypothetical protein
MFRNNMDKRVRLLLIRLLYSSLLLLAMDATNIITEFTAGAAVQNAYLAFMFSFVQSSITLINPLAFL